MHLVAKTYGKLPSDLLRLTWEEYQFSAAVLLAALEQPAGGAAEDVEVDFDWSDLT